MQTTLPFLYFISVFGLKEWFRRYHLGVGPESQSVTRRPFFPILFTNTAESCLRLLSRQYFCHAVSDILVSLALFILTTIVPSVIGVLANRPKPIPIPFLCAGPTLIINIYCTSLFSCPKLRIYLQEKRVGEGRDSTSSRSRGSAAEGRTSGRRPLIVGSRGLPNDHRNRCTSKMHFPFHVFPVRDRVSLFSELECNAVVRAPSRRPATNRR